MSNYRLMASFHDELTKHAVPAAAAGLGGRILGMGRRLVANPRVYGGLSGLGGGAGAGGLTGAAVGAGVGGYRGYQEARESGASVGGTIGHVIGKGLQTAGRGAVIGAGAGAVGGAALGATGRGKVLTDLAQREGMLGGATRMGQRQVYGLTGATPQGFMHRGGLEAMRGGTYDSMKRLTAAQDAVASPTAKRGLVDKVLGRSAEVSSKRQAAGAARELVAAKKGLQSSEDAARMGLTSIPGYANAIKEHGLMKAVGTGVKEQWNTMGVGGRALAFGIPAVTMGKELATKSEPGGPGRVERVLGQAGDLAYGMGPLPFTSQLALGGATRAIGSGVKKVRSKFSPHVAAPPQLDPAGGAAAPAEVVGSDRMAGLAGYTS